MLWRDKGGDIIKSKEITSGGTTTFCAKGRGVGGAGWCAIAKARNSENEEGFEGQGNPTEHEQHDKDVTYKEFSDHRVWHAIFFHLYRRLPPTRPSSVSPGLRATFLAAPLSFVRSSRRSLVSLPTSAALLSCWETLRTREPARSPRRGWVSRKDIFDAEMIDQRHCLRLFIHLREEGEISLPTMVENIGDPILFQTRMTTSAKDKKSTKSATCNDSCLIIIAFFSFQ